MHRIKKKSPLFSMALAALIAFTAWPTASMAGPATATIQYTIDEPGYVSLAVYERDSGRMLRTLLSGSEQEPGTHEVPWDGLDRLGNPVKPGSYEWKLLRTPGLTSEYLLTLGTNPGSRPFDSWPGNHNGIHGVAVDGDRLYVGSSGSEVSPTLLITSLDGTEQFGTRGAFEAWQGVVRLISRGEFYYVLQGNGRLFMSRTDGKWTGHHGAKNLAWPDPDAGEKDQKIDAAKTMDIAVHVGSTGNDESTSSQPIEQFVVSYRDRDAIRWLDPNTLDPHKKAEVEILDTAEVTAPAGVAIDAEGRVLVTSGDQLLRLSRQNKTPQILATGLTAPGRLDVCTRTGEILVVEGSPSHRIKRFAPDGTLLKTYGREGGRQQGLYVATDFLGVSDIAADGNGGFVICEMGTAPRRVTHFDREGEVTNEWYGGQQFFQHAHPDPADPTSVWMSSHWGWVIQAKVDYENRTWRVHATYRIQGMADGLIPGHMSEVGWEVRRRDGVAYLTQNGRPHLLRIDEENHRLIPMLSSGMQITHYWSAQPKLIQELLDNNRQSPSRSYIWTDRNGDGDVQPEEVQFYDRAVWWSGWSMDEDFNIYGTNGDTIFALPVTEWTEHGAPVYGTWMEPKALAEAPAGLAAKSLAGYSAGHSAIHRHQDGSLFSIFNDQSETHGAFWTGDMFVRTGLVRWSPDGDPLWVVGRHANTRPNPPGQTHNPVSIIGTVHDCVVVAERVAQPAVLWDMDGLYVGRFFDHRADDGLPDALYSWWRPIGGEYTAATYINYDMLVGGSIHKQPNGDVLWFAPGWNNTMVYRVTGWDGWTRQSGTVAVNEMPDHAKAQGSGLKATYFDNAELSAGMPMDGAAFSIDSLMDEVELQRIDEQVAFDWKKASPAMPDPASPESVTIDPEAFSARWEGQLEAKFTEDFIFSTYSMDGVRLWIDGDRIIDHWSEEGRARHFHYTKNLHFIKKVSDPISLKAGQKYDIKLEFYKSADSPEARIFLNWESPTLERQHVPSAYLYPAHP